MTDQLVANQFSQSRKAKVTPRKMAKYVLNKKSATGDKPAVARSSTIGQLDYSQVPFAYKDVISQE